VARRAWALSRDVLPWLLHGVGLLGLLLLAIGCTAGLAVAPREQFMGDVFRIAYIHAPTALAVFVCGAAAGGAALVVLVTRGPRWDGLLEGALEVSIVMVVLLLAQGAIWSRPTWGSYWSGDPRFFATAWFGLTAAGVLTLRAFVTAPERRALWSAVATIAVVLALPVAYKSVVWWPAIHPPSPDPDSLARGIAVPLGINFGAMTLVTIWLVLQRARVAWARDEAALLGRGSRSR